MKGRNIPEALALIVSWYALDQSDLSDKKEVQRAKRHCEKRVEKITGGLKPINLPCEMNDLIKVLINESY